MAVWCPGNITSRIHRMSIERRHTRARLCVCVPLCAQSFVYLFMYTLANGGGFSPGNLSTHFQSKKTFGVLCVCVRVCARLCVSVCVCV